MSNTLKLLQVPATMLALASVILIPTYFVSAQESVRENQPCALHENQPCAPLDRPEHLPAIPFEITSISDNDDGSGTISGTLQDVPDQMSEEEGIDEGGAVTINYTSRTKFVMDHEETTVEAYKVGDTAFAVGIIDFEAMTIDARFIVDKRFRARFHLGEVVDVDTTSNWILVKSLRPNAVAEHGYAYITYGDETSFNEDGEVVDESAITIGDKIHVEGDMNWDSEQYTVEISADHVALYDETLPPRPGRGTQGTNPGVNHGVRPQSNWNQVTE